MSSSDSKSTFFRQSGWMVIATVSGGVFMVFVQSVAGHMGDAEYSVFNTLLRLLILLGGVPSAALQTIFAQQAAAAITEERGRNLVATTRAILVATFCLWVATVLVVFAASDSILNSLKISNSAALWFTALLILPSLWVPLLKGVLQGQHKFGGLGWLQILDGVGRFGAVLIAVVLLHKLAAGAIFAALVGQIVTLAVGAWLTRDIWARRAHVPFVWRDWLPTAMPLTLGMGTLVAMQSIDTLFVGSSFSEQQTVLYVSAMLSGYAIIQFIGPITVVMFPKIVRSIARSEKTDALGLTLMVTAGFCSLAAIGCTIFPELPLKIIYLTTPKKWAASPLVPWFAWALLPQVLANVLIQNLLARKHFKPMIGFVLVPIAFAVTLVALKPMLLQLAQTNSGQIIALTRVIQILGLFNLLLFAIAAWFTWSKPKPNPAPSDLDSAAARSTSCKPNSPTGEAARAAH